MNIAIIVGENLLERSIMRSYRDAFIDLGHRVYVKSFAQGYTENDIISIIDFKPDFIIFYGNIGILKATKGYLFRYMKIPVVCLYYDNLFFGLNPDFEEEMKNYPEYYYSFIWDDVYLDIYNKMNLPNGHKILLALDDEKFYPMDIKKEKGIVIVGSLPKELDDFSTGNEICDKFTSDVIDLKIENIDIPVLEICDYLYKNIEEYKIVEDLYKYKTYQFWRGIYYKIHIAGGTKYRNYVASIIDDVDLYVYGECYLNKNNIHIRNRVNYGQELCKVYNSYEMNLNLSTLQLETSINNRPFDCFGSKSFVLSDYKKDLEVVFPDHYKEISFKNYNELGEKGEYYLSHEKERKEITEDLYNIIVSNHTYKHRAEYILDIFNNRR